MSKSQRPDQKGDQFGAEPSYQINTGKVIKGHKLTMKDLLQKKKIKSKNSSPTNKHKEFQQSSKLTPRITDFSEKYRGLQTLDDDESLYRFITYQRQKQSRESARGIKLFSCQKKGDTIEDDSYINNHISFTPRNAKTSQSHRKDLTSKSNSNNKTISYDNPNESPQQTSQNKISFLSDNLGKRMNEYLNIILQKKQKTELIINEEEIKQEAQLFRLKHELINQVRVINKHAKLKSNQFYRQMKKPKKNRILSAQSIPSEAMKSNELVKSLIRRTANQLNDKRMVFYNQELKKNPSGKLHERQKTPQKTTRSFYSKRQGRQKQSPLRDFNNVLTLIYQQ